MKLGTKIFLGFSAILAILIALGVIIIFQMTGVQAKSKILTSEYLPELVKVSDIKENTLFLRMNVLAATLSHKDEDIENSNKFYSELTPKIADFKEFTTSSEHLKIGAKHAQSMSDMAVLYKQSTQDMFSEIHSLREEFKNLVTYGGSFVASCEELMSQQKALEANLSGTKVGSDKIKERLYLTFDALQAGLIIRLKTASALYLKDITVLEGLMANNFPKLAGTIKKMSLLSPTQREEKNILNLSEMSNNYSTTIKKYIESWANLNAYRTAGAKIGADLIALTNEVNAAASTATSRVAIETNESLNKAIWVLISGLIIAIVVGIILAIVITSGITKPINIIISSLSEAGDQVAAASNEISSASQSLAEGATEQAASLEESSSALEEMASMTRQNADNAGNANQMMTQTQSQVTNGAAAVTNMAQAMNEINDSSAQTSRIIGTIEEIAFQTNLLALNAAVEAARAGDAGKGFAVVADEVRNLAQRSAQAARDTAELIESTVARVKNGTSIVEELQTSFGEVEGSVKHFGSLINEISAASNEQAQGVDQVNTAVAQMDKVTQTNAANAEESASASEELSAQASQLKSLVGELNTIVTGKNATLSHYRPMPSKKTGNRLNKLISSSSSTGGGSKMHNSSNLVKPHELIPLDDDDDFEDF